LPEPLFFTIREKIIQEGVISDYELIPDDDTKLTISLSGSLIRAPDGVPAGLILILHDITQRKNAEKALKKAHEKISLLTHLTRHDISNLIMVVSGYLELLKEEQNTEKREQMLTTCQEMTRKIMRHLHFSREYQSIGLHEPVWQDCDRLVKQAIDDLHLKGVNLHINLIPADIYADPLSVKVIYNILENALRHATGLTHIEISSHTLDDGSLLFMVKDNGTGIKPEEKEKIFTQGYGKNTGLGLTLAREILMVTNITINETGTYGKGAQFEIHIPPLSWRPKGITQN
jgi:signal transduction histidine kinase